MKPILLALAVSLSHAAMGEEIGGVNTEWNLAASHRLVVEAYDDPKVEGVTCYVAMPQRGGLAGAFGVAEETSDVSISCGRLGPIRVKEPLPRQEDAFRAHRSFFFKTLHVVRMVDSARNALVYLTYTDKLVKGSPKNSVSVVAVDRSIPIPVK